MTSLDIILELSCRSTSRKRRESFPLRKNDIYRELLKNVSPANFTDEVEGGLVELRRRNYKPFISSSSKNTKFILGQTGLDIFRHRCDWCRYCSPQASCRGTSHLCGEVRLIIQKELVD